MKAKPLIPREQPSPATSIRLDRLDAPPPRSANAQAHALMGQPMIGRVEIGGMQCRRLAVQPQQGRPLRKDFSRLRRQFQLEFDFRLQIQLPLDAPAMNMSFIMAAPFMEMPRESLNCHMTVLAMSQNQHHHVIWRA